MKLSIIKNDFKRNKTINITLLLFIILSAFLVSLGTMIPIQLFSSINNMYEIARPPHFMQMHIGDLNQSEIAEFADEIDYLEAWQPLSRPPMKMPACPPTARLLPWKLSGW